MTAKRKPTPKRKPSRAVAVSASDVQRWPRNLTDEQFDQLIDALEFIAGQTIEDAIEAEEKRLIEGHAEVLGETNGEQ